MQVIIMEMRVVVFVAVDAGIDQLVVKRIRVVQDPEKEGRCLRSNEAVEKSVGPLLCGSGPHRGHDK